MTGGYATAKAAYAELRAAIGPWARTAGFRRWAETQAGWKKPINSEQTLKFTFEGVNLTDEFQDQFNDSSNRVSFYHHTGREYLVGFRYTY